jgi:hypothetical protein
METATLNEEEMQRVTVNVDPDVPLRIPGGFILMPYDLAEAVQQLTEMTDVEVLTANQEVGGHNWVNDSQEDIYRDGT